MTIETETLLLLRLLEAKKLRFSHQGIVGYHGAAGASLIGEGLLAADGYGDAVRDMDGDEDDIFDVVLDRGRLGYYHPSRGWITVDQLQLQAYRPDLRTIFDKFLGGHLRWLPAGPVSRAPDCVWELGHGRLLTKGATEIWFARRLGDPAGWEAFEEAVRKRPAVGLRLVLTSSIVDLTRMPMHRILQIAEVMSSRDPGAIDFDVLTARFNGVPPPEVTGPIHLSDNGTQLTVNGTLIVFQGDVVKSIVRQFYNAYLKSEWLRASNVLGHAGSAATSLDKAFGKRWNEIRPHLENVQGRWRLKI